MLVGIVIETNLVRPYLSSTGTHFSTKFGLLNLALTSRTARLIFFLSSEFLLLIWHWVYLNHQAVLSLDEDFAFGRKHHSYFSVVVSNDEGEFLDYLPQIFI